MAVTVKIEFLFMYLVSYFNIGSRRGPEGKESTHPNNLKSSMRRRLYPIYTGIGGEYGREINRDLHGRIKENRNRIY